MTVETACSSSLMALHLACSSLSQFECSEAIVGGVNLMISPHASQYFGHIGALSATGRCRSFSSDADGYVRSEGGAVLVIKRLEDELKAGDTILSIVRGSATNHDGRSNGFTAPSGVAQRAVMHKALQVSGLQPQDVGYVECHGTGTILGYAI